jgi:hypothetical protein
VAAGGQSNRPEQSVGLHHVGAATIYGHTPVGRIRVEQDQLSSSRSGARLDHDHVRRINDELGEGRHRWSCIPCGFG